MPKISEPRWIDINSRRPPEYELYEFLTSENKILIGWRTGLHYEGLKIKSTDEILMWRFWRRTGHLMINQ